MKCISPVKKNQLVKGSSFKLDHPCGQCMPCRITKRQEWTFRLLMELREHEYNYFITLTYDDKKLPHSDKYVGGSLCKEDLQKFFKRLRKQGHKFRYFAVGEYGEKTFRAHYHIMLFMDYEMPLKTEIVKGRSTTYIQDIKKAWDKCSIYDAAVIPSTEDGKKVAQYVSGYCLKKVTNEESTREYFGDGRESEFTLMSRGTTCPKHRGKGKRPTDCPDCTFGIGFKAVEGIARGLISNKISASDVIGRPNAQGLYMVRYNKKLYPMSRTFRDKVIERLGGDGRTDLIRALRLHEQTQKREHENRDYEKYVEKLYDEEQRKMRAAKYAANRKRFTNKV
jgi:hypothetical protein